MLEKKNRIIFLDSLRGIAILLVMLFHGYVRWSELVFCGDVHPLAAVLKYGWLGVYLFFMISGFVILMTLENTANFFQFLYRRWLRLFPSMFIVSVLVFSTAQIFFSERPSGIPVWRDLIPGLTFIDDQVWQTIFNSPQGVLEGSFWSLFVEVRFYLIFGAMFYILGANKAIIGLVGMFLLYIFKAPFIWRLSPEYFGWFAAGALFYLYFKSSNRLLLLTGLLVALLSAFFKSKNVDVQLAAALMVLFFAFVVSNSRFQLMISTRFLIFLGFVSYPLYLVHENMMVALIIKFSKWFPWMPNFLLPIIPLVLIIGVSYPVANYFEPKLRDYLRRFLDTQIKRMAGIIKN